MKKMDKNTRNIEKDVLVEEQVQNKALSDDEMEKVDGGGFFNDLRNLASEAGEGTLDVICKVFETDHQQPVDLLKQPCIRCHRTDRLVIENGLRKCLRCGGLVMH